MDQNFTASMIKSFNWTLNLIFSFKAQESTPLLSIGILIKLSPFFILTYVRKAFKIANHSSSVCKMCVTYNPHNGLVTHIVLCGSVVKHRGAESGGLGLIPHGEL